MNTLALRVRGIDDSVPGIRSLALVSADGTALPAFGPGSHLILHCGERRNAYSLTSDPRDHSWYGVSVQLHPDGDGGSRWVHALAVGDPVEVNPPRNLFAPVNRARHSVYVAGGIGVTPLLAHLREAVRRGSSFEFIYAASGPASHLDEVRDLAGGRLTLVTGGRQQLTALLRERLARQPIGSYLYSCGPAGMLAAVAGIATTLGWPDERIRSEAFTAEVLPPGAPFTARLVRSNRVIAVPADTPLLDALHAAGVKVDNMCRQGVCGECRLPVRAGTIDHRDLYLDAAERAAGDAIMACVSRATGELELDL